MKADHASPLPLRETVTCSSSVGVVLAEIQEWVTQRTTLRALDRLVVDRRSQDIIRLQLGLAWLGVFYAMGFIMNDKASSNAGYLIILRH